MGKFLESLHPGVLICKVIASVGVVQSQSYLKLWSSRNKDSADEYV